MLQTVTTDDYLEIMRRYGDYIQRAVGDKYVGLTAKWQFEDLVPGLSDIDFRVILTDQATPADWLAADRASGEIHRTLAEENRSWWRYLEHPPGCGLTTVELIDDRWYSPEYRSWQVCHGDENLLVPMRDCHRTRQWDSTDELYHLKKFLSYYGPYQEGIDAPINLGSLKHKYPLHSRCWHYFMPPMWSVASLIKRETLPGKKAALRFLIKKFPGIDVCRQVLETVNTVYEVPELHDLDLRAMLDLRLVEPFVRLEREVRDSLQYFAWPDGLDAAAMKADLAAGSSSISARSHLIDAVRFGRIRLGRYLFYLDPPPGFEAEVLLRREDQWADVIAKVPVEIGRQLMKLGEIDANPAQVVKKVLSRPLDEAEALGLTQVYGLPARATEPLDQMKLAFQHAADSWPAFYFLLEAYCAFLFNHMEAD